MAKLTQCEKIIRHIKDHGSITAMEAMQDYGIMRLASRIADLKEQGYFLIKSNESGRNRYGEKTTYARYFLYDYDSSESDYEEE